MTGIEKVARALYAHDQGFMAAHGLASRKTFEEGGAAWMPLARAAIEALREPNEAVLACLMHQEEATFDDLEDCWAAAIDTLLNEKAP